ncbi:MAG: lysophospholipid acyltransferase family protein [Thermodesulfobacteriota bacterium]
MYFILYSLVYLLSWIPRPLGLRLGDFIGGVLYKVLTRRREIALKNLVIAFGDQKNSEERKAIARRVFQNMGRHFFEACYLIRYDKKKLATYVRFEGLHHFDQAVAQGKGVIFLTGHFGFWELLAVSSGYFLKPSYLVAKPLDFKPADKLVRTIRGVSGNQCITKEKSMRRLIQVLKQGAIVAVLLDQNIDWKDGIFVPFFNKRACTNKGLALLVRKTGVPVVPVFMRDTGHGKYLVEFQPPLSWLSFDDRTKEIEENTAQYNQAIEAMARRYPEQYFWVHQRWKTRPYQPWPKEKQHKV